MADALQNEKPSSSLSLGATTIIVAIGDPFVVPADWAGKLVQPVYDRDTFTVTYQVCAPDVPALGITMLDPSTP